jgi:aminomethyltransferase
MNLPLHPLHLKEGGYIVDFHGFALPVRFSSILEESAAVRERSGLFDISHMGHFEIRGSGVVQAVNRLITSDLERVSSHKALYGHILTEEGGVIDDIMAYRFGEERVDLIVNASNRDIDRKWIEDRLPAGIRLADHSEGHVGMALQGPKSPRVIGKILPSLIDMGRREARTLFWKGGQFLVSRTGYTGEDGWELFGPSSEGFALYSEILESGKVEGILLPAGLGARDLLRLEAGYPLYGQELTLAVTSFDARLDFAVSRSKGAFVGKEAILDASGNPVRHEGHPVLTGFFVEGRGIPRTDCTIENASGVPVGKVTSGGYSPRVGGGFGLGFVDPGFDKEFRSGISGKVRIHGQALPISFRQWPFVKGGVLKAASV